MVRLLHAKTPGAVDDAFRAASVLLSGAPPLLLLVYSEDCGHCVRMMPAFRDTLELLAPASRVLKLAVDALRGSSDSAIKRRILDRVSGVPFVAMVTPGAVPRIVPLPASSDRSVASLSTFAQVLASPRTRTRAHARTRTRTRTLAGTRDQPTRTASARMRARGG